MNKDNFLAKFKDQVQLDSVSFMKIWAHYDSDHSGYLDSKDELEQFARDLLEAGDEVVSDLRVKELLDGLGELFDTNSDGRLGLAELAEVLQVEENFLARFNGRDALAPNELEQIFAHYDTDGSGSIQGDELRALMRDLLRRFDREPSTAEIDLYMAQIVGFIDADADGGINLAELARLFPSP